MLINLGALAARFRVFKQLLGIRFNRITGLTNLELLVQLNFPFLQEVYVFEWVALLEERVALLAGQRVQMLAQILEFGLAERAVCEFGDRLDKLHFIIQASFVLHLVDRLEIFPLDHQARAVRQRNSIVEPVLLLSLAEEERFAEGHAFFERAEMPLQSFVILCAVAHYWRCFRVQHHRIFCG